MPLLFKAKTHEGYIFKILAELLKNNIKTACFVVDNDGITLSQMNKHRTIFICIKLNSENFSLYKFNSQSKIFLGINLIHFHKMIKSVKKKDSIEFFISEKNTQQLGFKVIPKEGDGTTTHYIPIKEIQTINIETITGYNKQPVNVQSVKFQKMLKTLSQISGSVTIYSKAFQIKFSADADGLMNSSVEFGENDSSDEEDHEDDINYEEYEQQFKTEHLSKIAKISGLSNNLKIFPKEGLPLLFRTQIGSIGTLSLYLKSISDIAQESNPTTD